MKAKTKPCPFCGGNPKLKRVGDQKEYVVFFCSDCGKTPVHHDEARYTVWGARRIWNKRAKKIILQEASKK